MAPVTATAPRFMPAIPGYIASTLCLGLGLMFPNLLIGQELTRVMGPDHPLLAQHNVYLGDLQADRLGNIYSVSSRSVIRISPTGDASLVLKLAVASNHLLLGEDSSQGLTAEGEPVALYPISDFVVNEAGDIYLAGRETDNVVRIHADGTLEEILTAEGDGQGQLMDRPQHLAIDDNGFVYASAGGSHNLFRVSPAGDIALFLDREAGGHGLYVGGGVLLFDPDNNAYVNTYDAVLKITPDGVIAETFTGDQGPLIGDPDPLQLLRDDFGNLYFMRFHDRAVYRFNNDGTLDKLIDETGDGTGEIHCVQGPFGTLDCEYFGNWMSYPRQLHLDPAQNLFVTSPGSMNIFKVGPSGAVTEIRNLNDIEDFNLDSLNDSVVDPFGNFFLRGGNNEGIFKLAPMPIGLAEDFSLDPPHSGVFHDADGATWMPQSYSLTRFSADASDPNLQGLDTREEPLSALPWQNATVATEISQEPLQQAIGVQLSALSHNGATYSAEVRFLHFDEPSLDEVMDIVFRKDGEDVFNATGLAFPRNSLTLHSGQYLMRWLYYRNDIINGGDGNDVLYGFDGNDILYGGAGDDAFNGGRGYDIFYGGAGVDTVYYESDRQDYGLSRDPQTGVTQIQPKVGLAFPTADLAQADIEYLQFRDARVPTNGIGYWGESGLAGTPVPDNADETVVYRFYNTRDRALFFTAEEAEKTEVIRNGVPRADQAAVWPYVFHGAKFRSAHSYPGAVPLYRFYNYRTGHHFFTADDDEVSHVRAQTETAGWPFIYEGPRFDVYPDDPNPGSEGLERPVHRYYSPTLDRHFFTTSEKEAARLDVMDEWHYEGVRFWVETLFP